MKGLIHRAYKLCDLEEDLKSELGFLKDMFISNGYPIRKVDKVFATYKPNVNRNDVDNDQEDEDDHLLSMSVPYVPGLAEKFQSIMRKEGIKVVFMKGQTLQNELCKLKPMRGKLEKKDVVYMVGCKICNARYIGETSQKFTDRASQHQRCIKRQNEKNGFYMHIKKSLGRRHKSKGCEAMDWMGAVFLDSEMHWKKRKIKESLYINAYDASNRMRDLMNLEKGCKIDPCWNVFNDAIKEHISKKINKAVGQEGSVWLKRLRPRPKLKLINNNK